MFLGAAYRCAAYTHTYIHTNTHKDTHTVTHISVIEPMVLRSLIEKPSSLNSDVNRMYGLLNSLPSSEKVSAVQSLEVSVCMYASVCVCMCVQVCMLARLCDSLCISV